MPQNKKKNNRRLKKIALFVSALVCVLPVSGKTEKSKTPIAVSGRVLAYPYEDRKKYKSGDAVCSGPNGTISKMSRLEIILFPERIIGTVSSIPSYETWGEDNIKINNRIWINVR